VPSLQISGFAVVVEHSKSRTENHLTEVSRGLPSLEDDQAVAVGGASPKLIEPQDAEMNVVKVTLQDESVLARFLIPGAAGCPCSFDALRNGVDEVAECV
jgi:hypothetical protein